MRGPNISRGSQNQFELPHCTGHASERADVALDLPRRIIYLNGNIVIDRQILIM